MKPDWESKCGTIRLYNADCRDVLPFVKCDAVITDPPYGISFAAQPTKWQRRAGMQPEAWDDDVADISPLLTMGKQVVIWGGNYYPLPQTRGWLTWFKPDSPPSMADFELAWTNQDMNAKQISHSISATNAERVGHPTQKPVRVMLWSMEQVKVPDDAMVFDPFMGSGTTCIACSRTGRRFIGCELDPKHFATAVSRITAELSRAPLFTPPTPNQTTMFEDVKP